MGRSIVPQAGSVLAQVACDELARCRDESSRILLGLGGNMEAPNERRTVEELCAIYEADPEWRKDQSRAGAATQGKGGGRRKG